MEYHTLNIHINKTHHSTHYLLRVALLRTWQGAFGHDAFEELQQNKIEAKAINQSAQPRQG